MNRLLAVLALAVLTSAGCCCGPNCLCSSLLWTGHQNGCGDNCGDDCGQGCDCGNGYGCDQGGGCCNSCGQNGQCGQYQCAQTDPRGRCGGGICGYAADGCPLCCCNKCGLFHRYTGPGCGCPCETYGGCDHCCPCPCQCCANGPGCCASGDQNYNFAPGPPTGQVAYPYYTVRGPRDFLMNNPPTIGPY